jgi:hypothetical protein
MRTLLIILLVLIVLGGGFGYWGRGRGGRV